MPDPKHSRTALEQEVLSTLTAESISWLTGIPRSTLRDRKPPRNDDGTYSAQEVVAWLLAEIQDDATAAPGQSSPELEKWRAIRRRQEELRYGREIGEIESRAVIWYEVDQILDLIRAFGERCIRTHPDTAGTDWRETLQRVDEVVARLCESRERHRELVVYLDDDTLTIPLDIDARKDTDQEFASCGPTP